MSAQFADDFPDRFTAYLHLEGGVHVHLEAPNMSALADVLARVRPVAPANDKAVKADKPKAEKPKAEKPVADAQAEKPPAETVTADKGEGAVVASEAAPKVTLDEIRTRVQQVTAKAGREAVIEALKKFKVTRAGEMNPAQFAEFMADTEALVA